MELVDVDNAKTEEKRFIEVTYGLNNDIELESERSIHEQRPQIIKVKWTGKQE